MITYDEAKSIVVAAGSAYALKTEMVATADIVGHVCAKDIDAPISVQPFDNSAMDGFAVRYDDVSQVDENSSVTLKRVMVIAAGDSVPEVGIKSGECAQIMTGAPMPAGADSVVPVECVSMDDGEITFAQVVIQGSHVRKAGEDFQKGAAVLKRGDVLGAQHIMALATLGVSEVEVFRKPRVASITTGKELVDDLSKDLQSGKIYNSNGPYIKEALIAFGAEVISCGTVADDLDVFQGKLKCIMKNDVDIVISTGAVSAGAFDFVKEALENIGAEILFHKVLARPGKPILCAKLPNGTLYFGLPGNPAASSVGLRFFVAAAMRAMRSQEAEKPQYAKLMTPFAKKEGWRMFLKAKTESWDDGLMTVDLFAGQASFMVSPFLQMNCWAVGKETESALKAGDIIEIYPLYPDA
ncbi:MAG: molybdopterin molybdenumtransferase MoeA [Alphaproteobacteria bacterium]|nr:MAG: molybdopterin molybdenumtransferase MoeA [Alphaproteobacteria bacterium]